MHFTFALRVRKQVDAQSGTYRPALTELGLFKHARSGDMDPRTRKIVRLLERTTAEIDKGYWHKIVVVTLLVARLTKVEIRLF